MDRPIDRIQAKLQRANQHVEDFQIALREYFDTKPYGYAVRDDPQAGRRHYYVDRLDPVPLNVEAIASDALGNLREAIDHIAYQIELAACGATPKQQVYFPVGRNAANYLTNRRAFIKCAGQTAIDAFDATEPYIGGKGEAIWNLNQLQKAGKHHLLVATTATFGMFDMGVISTHMFATSPDTPDWARGAKFPSVLFRSETSQVLKLGDEFFSEPSQPEMYKESPFRIEISFDRPDIIGPESALKTLKDFTNLVDGLVAAFAPLLP